MYWDNDKVDYLYAVEIDYLWVWDIFIRDGEINIIFQEDECNEKIYPSAAEVSYKKFTPAKVDNLQDLKKVLSNKNMVIVQKEEGWFVLEPEYGLLEDDSCDLVYTDQMGSDILTLIKNGCVGVFGKEQKTTLGKLIKMLGIE